MADLGNCGRAVISPVCIHNIDHRAAVGNSRSVTPNMESWAWPWYAPNDPPGRGNSFTIPTLNKVVLTFHGRFVHITQGDSGAVFYDVTSGIYYAYELNNSACWKVEITSSTVVVTSMSSGGGGTSASAYVLT